MNRPMRTRPPGGRRRSDPTPARLRASLGAELETVRRRLRRLTDELDRLDPVPLDGDGADTALALSARQDAAMEAQRLRARAAELERAMRRLDDEAWDRCADCGAPIGTRRLLALPTATTCAPCQELRDRARAGG